MTPAARLARPRRWSGVLVWAPWALAMLGLAAVPWSDHLLRQAGRPDLVQLTPGIISRTLTYGLLTVLLGGGYAGVVLGLGQFLRRTSSLAVAGATLALAAAFQPARRRVQQAVDRRFNRHRYDAARTIAGFSDRLRQQVDLDTLTAELLAVVDQTMQPTRASLWLRPSVSASQDQSRTSAIGRRGEDP